MRVHRLDVTVLAKRRFMATALIASLASLVIATGSPAQTSAPERVRAPTATPVFDVVSINQPTTN